MALTHGLRMLEADYAIDQFVADVESVEGEMEVHVLTTTRYEGEGANERAVKQNQKIVYVVRDREGGGERRDMWSK